MTGACLLVVVTLACGGSGLRAVPCHTGIEDCPCFDDGTCKTGLVCVAGACVPAPGDPGGGDPAGGDPGGGDPGSGDPAGDPDGGDPGDSDPPGDPSACNPTSPPTYVSSPAVDLYCAFGAVDLIITSWQFSGSSILVVAPSPRAPGSLYGALTTCPSGSFSVTTTLPGGCCETYTLTGSFTGPDTWAGTFTTAFCQSPACGCADGDDFSCDGFGDPCVGQSYNVTGTR